MKLCIMMVLRQKPKRAIFEKQALFGVNCSVELFVSAVLYDFSHYPALFLFFAGLSNFKRKSEIDGKGFRIF